MDLDRVKGVFLGGKLRIVGTVLLALILVVGAGFLVGVFGVPSVEAVENQFGGVNETTTVIETDLVVNNPNPFGVKLGGSTLDYSVAMNDVRMAEGTYQGLGIGSGNSTLNFTSYMDNGKIPDWWVSHVSGGEHTTVSVDATVHSSLLPISIAPPAIERDISTDITAAFNTTETRPIDANQPFVSDPVLYLNETSGHWGEVTANRTEVVMDFTVYNPKSYPVGASEIGYDMSMNGIAVGEGATSSSVTVPPGETRTITTTTAIRNQRLDDWWVTHLERNQRTNLTIDFYAKFDFSGVGGGTVQIPLDSMTSSFETDIFGTKGQAASGGTGGEGTDGANTTDGGDATTDDGDSSTETGGDSGTATGGSETADGDNTTDAGDDGGSTTAEPTPTETDDGGLLG